MTKSHYTALAAVALSAALVACSGGTDGGESDDYANGTVRLLVPYSAGGPSDLGVRAIAPCMQENLGGTWVVENKPGAAGATAMLDVAQADADGYTLGVGTQSTLVTTPVVEPSAGYDYTDFTHVGQIMEFPSVIMVHPDSPFATIEDLLEAEEDVTFGTSGSQVSFSLALQQMAQEGYPFTVVPFQGTAEANTAALGKNVDARWEGLDETTLNLINGGQMRPLAVSTDERAEDLPDVPTMAESGITDIIDTRTFYPMVGPADLPADVQESLTTALEACTADEEYAAVVGESRAVFADAEAVMERLQAYQGNVERILNG